MAAVDSLTEKRIKEFIEVERAIHTGETIVPHGATEKMLAHMRQASYAAEQTPEPVIIDHETHPLVRRHKEAP